MGERGQELVLLPGRFRQCFFSFLSGMDVHAGADVSKEPSVSIMDRGAMVEYPAVLAISALHAEIHGERNVFIKSFIEDPYATLHIIWMNILQPSHSQFLIHCSAHEIEPWLV